ncbi:hypothetical protein DFP73DRAFT_520971 [Morchella snyderi]|nr:hypothetical protein DFP73DRAFT_520971 [Morchella snyderi]
MAPRIVRQAPLSDRVLAALNPLDALLNLSTWLSSQDWDGLQTTLATPLGLTLNVLYLFTRAHSDSSSYRRGAEDVIRRGAGSTSGMGAWGSAMVYSCHLVSWSLAILSIANALYCAFRTRPYRLFENNIEIQPQTPSARRVRVDSEPTTSPIKFLATLLEPFLESPSTREHPSATRDVWEVRIWDPTPLSLRLLALFSPAHVAIYFLSFPVARSLTYSAQASAYTYQPTANTYAVLATALATQLAVTAQLSLLQRFFTQQAADKALLSRQLMHEYDTKFVRPRVNTVSRDVAVQTADPRTGALGEVDTYSPMMARPSAFRTAPNPNYAPLTTAGPTQLFPPASPRTHDYGYGYSPLAAAVGQPRFSGASSAARRAPSGASADQMQLRQESGWRSQRQTRAAAAAAAAGGVGGGPASNVGMHGLVNMSLHNSRSLSPSKMVSPFKRVPAGRGGMGGGLFATRR